MINNDNNINGLNMSKSNATESNNTSREITSLINDYKKFKTKMNKSEFSNSFPRYCAELEYLKKIRELMTEQNKFDENIEQEEKKIREILENEFGFIPNE